MVLVACAAAPASGSTPRHFAIPSGPLRDALVSLGGQAGISIGLSDQGLGALQVHGFTGDATIEQALGRLLRGLPVRSIAIDEQTYRIVRRSLPAAPVPAARPSIMAVPTPDFDIVVTASKRGVGLDEYPGSAIVLDGATLLADAGGGTEAIVTRLPTLGSTHLGPGRNKLFIRGIADSSFNGPTQATVGQYLGDVRLTYAAPDPDLSLYDVASVEVLEGPQGTLYGAGSLGGIFRIVPEPVKLDQVEGSVSAGLSTVAHGAMGSDAAAVLNMPLIAGDLGVRMVAYREIDGGYIDDAERGLSNVNRTRTIGGRIALLAKPGDDWTIDVGGTLQNIDSADGQYAERGMAPLTRRSALAQPFDNDYLLGDVVVSKTWGRTTLVSATGIVDHDVSASYDFTPAGGAPTIFTQENRILLISNETKLARTAADGSGWLLGTSFVSNSERLTRNLGPIAAPVRIIGVRNVVTEGAVYGEATVTLLPRLMLTFGGRVSFDRLVGETLDQVSAQNFEHNRDEIQVLPSAALSWHPIDRVLVFARYQEGFRPGGLSIAAGTGGSAVQRFHSDSIVTGEAGVRVGNSSHGAWDAAATLSYAHWRSIQADLVDALGLPYTANIGTGQILGFELRAGWHPVPGLRIEGGLFLNDSQLEHPFPGFEDAKSADLPNISELGGRAGAHYSTALTALLNLSVDASANYVGRSRLGVGTALDIPQGRYLDTAVRMRISRKTIGVTMGVTNVFDKAGNRFSLGDPFGVMDRMQVTPLQPRTVRIGLDANF